MDNIPANCWILGGTGFVGSAIRKELAASKNWRINILVHRRFAGPGLEPYNCVRSDLGNIDFYWFERFHPDIIFHSARLGGSLRLTRKIASYRGLKANRRLLKYFRSKKGTTKLLYVSGSLLYGNQSEGNSASELSSLNPVSFAREYVRAETPWMENLKQENSFVQIARPGWIIGPGSWFKTFFWDHYTKTKSVPLYGDGEQLMSLIHIDDLGRALVKIPEYDYPIINLFGAPPISQKKFSQLMANQLGVEIQKISLKQLRQKWGKAEADALGSSIPLTSNCTEFYKGIELEHTQPESMLRNVIGMLKSE